MWIIGHAKLSDVGECHFSKNLNATSDSEKQTCFVGHAGLFQSHTYAYVTYMLLWLCQITSRKTNTVLTKQYEDNKLLLCEKKKEICSTNKTKQEYQSLLHGVHMH